MTEKGIDTPTIACVEGIPYSNTHLLCNLKTGAPGLGHWTISLIPCPIKIGNQLISHRIVKYKLCGAYLCT